MKTMHNRKTIKSWIACMLIIVMALSDGGIISVFAEEDTTAVESSVSENNEERPQESVSENETEKAEEVEEAEAGLPALQIGQIKTGEDLPDPEDTEFRYDLPVSFETSDSLTLFVNYDIDGISGIDEKGTLIWSILCGEQGMEAGSTSLVDEEDDWTGFEVVSDSPYFTVTEKDAEESGYCKRIELVSKETYEQTDYDYYIRAAYYLENETDKDEAFYAAVTVPFLPQNDDTDVDITQDDALVSEDADQEEKRDDALTEATDAGEAPEDIDAENFEMNSMVGIISTLSENDITDEDSAPSESDTTQPEPEESISGLTLDRTSITMQPGETQQLTAVTEPANISVKILWESSDENVATVDETGMIKAKAEGFTQITAECGDLTAVAKVEVAPENSSEKLLDLSGDIWVAGFKRESEDLVYTGQKITQDIRIYHKETLLIEKTDYTLTYKNNINAAAYNAAKAPSVTINLKGQYSGSVTLYYTINPLNINDIDRYDTAESDTAQAHSPGYEQTVNYSKSLKIPSPALTFGTKKLVANKDFTCDYSTLPEGYTKGDSYEAGKVYDYTVNGIGNFTGSFQMQLVVLTDKNLNFSSAAVTLGQKQYEYHGTALSGSEVTIEQLKLNKEILAKNLYDYEVCTKGITGSYVMVYPSEEGRAAGYRGCKKVTLKLTGDRNIAEAASGEKWQESIVFSQKTVDKYGGMFQESTGLLTFGAEREALVEGEDYTVKYSNAKKAGNVTVTFTGIGRYKGSLKKKYEIAPNNDKANLTIIWGENVTDQNGELEVAYQKGGAVPDLSIRDQDKNILKVKTDYTVKIKDNKTPGTAMSCEISGKGNYKGYTETVLLKVTTGDIGLASISIPDKPYSTRQNAWKSTVTIKDVNGKKLAAGTDYDKQIEYTYESIESGQLPQAGSTVTVTVRGTGCYADSTITGSYRIYEKSISQLKIAIDSQEYTGAEILLLPGEDIHAYATSADLKKKTNELKESCYEIIEYKNNIKAGTAKVTLHGIGDYGGTKTYSFKIEKKKYLVNRVEKVVLNATTLSMLLAEQKTLTAELTPNTPGSRLDNPTIIWTSSNSNVASVETVTIQGTTVTGAITAKKAGTVTITATAQDGGKKAQCKLTIVDAPLLKEAGQTIEMESDEGADRTYQLTLEWGELQEQKTEGLVWESSNSEVVSADQNGLLTIKKGKVGTVIIKLYANNRKHVQQCYVVVKGEETPPEGNVLTYNQKPGTMDDTEAINKLLRDWEWNPNATYDCLYIPAGVYRIDAVSDPNREGFFGGIVLTSNQTLIMSPNALLVAIPNSSTDYHVIYAFGRDNITISGGQIVGERNEHTGSKGEWGHGIDISGCTNVYISDMDISQCWGDGIYLGYYDGPNECSNGVTIENCNLHHNRRSNLSITDVQNVTINNCQFSYASGTDPQYGIDIEPNNGRLCTNIKIYNSTFTGNAKASMGIITRASDIRLENCTLDGAFYNMAGKNVVLKNTTIKGEIVDQTGGIKRE